MWSRLHVRWGNGPHVTSPTWGPPPSSCKTAAKKCTKKVCCPCKVAFLLISPLLFFTVLRRCFRRLALHDSIECFHMTSRRPYWCPKPILWELNSFLMQMLTFVPVNLDRWWPRDWKRSIVCLNKLKYYRELRFALAKSLCYFINGSFAFSPGLIYIIIIITWYCDLFEYAFFHELSSAFFLSPISSTVTLFLVFLFLLFWLWFLG